MEERTAHHPPLLETNRETIIANSERGSNGVSNQRPLRLTLSGPREMACGGF